MSSLIYLDNNATTPPLLEVVEVVARVMRDCFGNLGSPHRAGRKARQVLEESREQIAGWLGANPKELIFTSGGTEANNLAMRGLTHGLAGTIAISPGEHPSLCLNHPSTALQFRSDLRDVSSLETGLSEFLLARLSRAISSRDGCRTPRRASLHFADVSEFRA